MQDPTPRRSAFVIATKNRPDSLLTTVKTLVSQTVLPAELCIVDASDVAPTRPDVEALCADVGITLDYHHPAPAGLCRQRNIGIDRTNGDPIVFVDDDVELEADCHENLLAEYDRRGPEVGAVCGSDLSPPRSPALPLLWRRLFGLSTWTTAGTGRMKPSFYVDAISRSHVAKEVEYMNGWLMSCRRHVVDEERFDESLPGYAQKEDMDLAYRVSRRWTIIKTPDASGVHLQVGTSRLPPRDLAEMSIENQFYLHRKNMPQTLKYKVALWWALLGFSLLNLGKAVVHRDPGFFTGVIAGIRKEMRRSSTSTGSRSHSSRR